MKTFLQGLGFSAFEVKKLLSNFGKRSLELLKTPEGRYLLSKEVESASIRAAHMQYTRIWTGTKLYQSLEPFGVQTESIYRFFLSCGGDAEGDDAKEAEREALSQLKKNPYTLVIEYGALFPPVDKARETLAPDADLGEERVEAAVYSALRLSERGSEEFGKDKFSRIIDEVSGSTCLPIGRLITLSQLLLKDTATADEIVDAAKSLHKQKKVLLTKKKDLDGNSVVYAYRQASAEAEFAAAELLKERLSSKACISSDKNPYEVIDTSQASLGLYLSYEQVDAVMMALTHNVSVITGGPGTGKTQTQKVLLEAFRRLYGNLPVTLMAPTGQAAKNMTKATGKSATTIHLALGIMPGEKDLRRASDLKNGLIVVDESSMLDRDLLWMVLAKAPKDAKVVFIGDADQLPSVGAGNVLAELTKCVPTARLTKIFRQEGDAADIAYNAARIKVGTTKMIEGERFTFIEADKSEDIQKAVCRLYKEETERVGDDNVIVLSPLRRNTKTGVNQLNVAIRKTVSSEKRYIEHAGIRLYQKDKIVFLKNKHGLVNGDIGVISEIRKDSAVCKFGDKEIILSGSKLGWITPAYAETIHKSQGDEYPVVILVADKLHRSTRAMTYTAVTRSREKVYVVGSRDAFETSIKNAATGRCSCLSAIASS